MDLTLVHIASKDAPVIYVVDSPEHPLPLQAASADLNCTVASYPIAAWGDALTPWPAKPLYRGEAPYAGQAAETLSALHAEITRFEDELSLAPCARSIAGYSLGGLFALYAFIKPTHNPFAAAASISGSLWYEGWCEWLEAQTVSSAQHFAYISLGTKERRASRPQLKTVGEATKRTAAILQSKGIETELRYGPGGHINNQIERLILAFKALEVAMQQWPNQKLNRLFFTD